MRNNYIDAIKAAVNYECFYQNLYQYILYRYQLEKDTVETNLLMLAKMSFLRQNADAHLTEKQLESAVSKSDCRGTNSIVKKKILLMMNLEKKLGVYLEDTASADIDTVEELAGALYPLWREAYAKSDK